MVEQEIWGYLLTHYAISALVCTAATAAGIDPDRVKFKRAVRVVRRRVEDPAFPPDHRHSLERVIAEITSRGTSTRRQRTYPRASSEPHNSTGQETGSTARRDAKPRRWKLFWGRGSAAGRRQCWLESRIRPGEHHGPGVKGAPGTGRNS